MCRSAHVKGGIRQARRSDEHPGPVGSNPSSGTAQLSGLSCGYVQRLCSPVYDGFTQGAGSPTFAPGPTVVAPDAWILNGEQSMTPILHRRAAHQPCPLGRKLTVVDSLGS